MSRRRARAGARRAVSKVAAASAARARGDARARAARAATTVKRGARGSGRGRRARTRTSAARKQPRAARRAAPASPRARPRPRRPRRGRARAPASARRQRDERVEPRRAGAMCAARSALAAESRLRVAAERGGARVFNEARRAQRRAPAASQHAARAAPTEADASAARAGGGASRRDGDDRAVHDRYVRPVGGRATIESRLERKSPAARPPSIAPRVPRRSPCSSLHGKLVTCASSRVPISLVQLASAKQLALPFSRAV